MADYCGACGARLRLRLSPRAGGERYAGVHPGAGCPDYDGWPCPKCQQPLSRSTELYKCWGCLSLWGRGALAGAYPGLVRNPGGCHGG